ncbi:hypothetical protein [Saccharospirillum alexandrii]|uniref:hypothetical protein n=1 Tax=Saccharospirillum alexandrii TaxID=2448477 RepID=UPI003735078B
MAHYTIIDVISKPKTEAGLQKYDVTIEDVSGKVITKTILTPPGKFRDIMSEHYPDAKIIYSFDTSVLDEFLDPEQDQ